LSFIVRINSREAEQRVLIVDDEASDAAMLRAALEKGGYTVYSAANFDEAVHVFEEHPEIDLALLDVALPGRNGVELAKHLLARKSDLRLLFISGHVGASVIRFHGLNATDDHFLQKPFDDETLLRRVKRALAADVSETPLLGRLPRPHRGSEPTGRS
jgi:DNA-binding response OmpR family regulator